MHDFDEPKPRTPRPAPPRSQVAYRPLPKETHLPYPSDTEYNQWRFALNDAAEDLLEAARIVCALHLVEVDQESFPPQIEALATIVSKLDTKRKELHI